MGKKLQFSGLAIFLLFTAFLRSIQLLWISIIPFLPFVYKGYMVNFVITKSIFVILYIVSFIGIWKKTKWGLITLAFAVGGEIIYILAKSTIAPMLSTAPAVIIFDIIILLAILWIFLRIKRREK